MRNKLLKILIIIASSLTLLYFTNCDNHTNTVSYEEDLTDPRALDINILSPMTSLFADANYHYISGQCDKGDFSSSLIKWEILDNANNLRMDSEYALSIFGAGAESSCDDAGTYNLQILSLAHRNTYADGSPDYYVDYNSPYRLRIFLYGLDQNGLIVQSSAKEFNQPFNFVLYTQ